MNQFELVDSILREEYCAGYLCNKMYKTKILKENNLKLNPKIHLMEDLVFNLEYSKYIKNAFWANDFFGYFYVQRNDSVLNSQFNIKQFTKLYALDNIIKSIEDHPKMLDKYKFMYQKDIIQFKFEMRKKRYEKYIDLKKYLDQNYSKYYNEVKKNTSDFKERFELVFSYKMPYLYGFTKKLLHR